MKTQCQCLPSQLKSILDKAIASLESESIGTRTEDYERIRKDLEVHIDALKGMGIPETQLEQMRKSIPVDPMLKQFEDLKRWTDSCECPEGTEFNWTQFPYQEVGYKEVGVGKEGRVAAFKSVENQIKAGLCAVSGISVDEALADVYRIKALSEKSIEALSKPEVVEYMNKKYPGGWAQSSYKLELVKLGIMTPTDYDEWNRLITNVKQSCAGKDLYNKWENDIYAIRKQLKLKIQPKPEQLKRR